MKKEQGKKKERSIEKRITMCKQIWVLRLQSGLNMAYPALQ